MPFFTLIKNSSDKQFKKIFDKNNEISVGYFHLLPDEIIIQILKYLSIMDMANFSLTNRIIRNFIIENFIISSSGYNYLIKESKIEYEHNDEKQTAILQLFSSIGS